MARTASSWLRRMRLHLLPALGGRQSLHHAGDCRVAFQQLRAPPSAAGRVRDAIGAHDAARLRARTARWSARISGACWGARTPRPQATSAMRLHQLVARPGCSAAVMATTGTPSAASSTCGSMLEPLLAGHVHHVQAHHQRHSQGHQLGHQVEAALQDGRVDDRDHHVRALGDDVLAGDQLFRRVGRQAVGAGQVHDGHGQAIVRGRRRSAARPSCPASCPRAG